MSTEMLQRYAHLVVDYSLNVQHGERVLIRTSTAAEPFVKELYVEILKAGGHPHVLFSMDEEQVLFYEYSAEHQLAYVNPLLQQGLTEFEKYLYIIAPTNLREGAAINVNKRKQVQKALAPFYKKYTQRTADGSMERSLCLYPTAASAQEAGMSLSAYSDFVFGACGLKADDPKGEWLALSKRQQTIVDYLNTKSEIRYVNDKTDISYRTEGRTWINSDGRTNMPSGEVYTSPEEDSVNGHIYFDYPSIHNGEEVQGVRLEVVNGYIESWSAEQGQHVLDKVFQVDGTRRFGEAAIGTNMNIQTFTKNILFDEKIGGTVHMAIGQSYLQCGGKNESAVHWDMIADMTQSGKIYADGELFYENGKFLIG